MYITKYGNNTKINTKIIINKKNSLKKLLRFTNITFNFLPKVSHY